MYEDVSLPTELFPELSDSSSRIVFLAHRYGLLLGKAEDAVSVGTASAPAATALAPCAGLAGDGRWTASCTTIRRPAGRMASRAMPPRHQLRRSDALIVPPAPGLRRLILDAGCLVSLARLQPGRFRSVTGAD